MKVLELIMEATVDQWLWSSEIVSTHLSLWSLDQRSLLQLNGITTLLQIKFGCMCRLHVSDMNTCFCDTIAAELSDTYLTIVTRSPTVLKVYINGTLVDTIAGNGAWPASPSSTSTFWIGRSTHYNYDLHLNALLDDLRFYNRILNASEVLSIFNYNGCDAGFYDGGEWWALSVNFVAVRRARRETHNLSPNSLPCPAFMYCPGNSVLWWEIVTEIWFHRL